MRANMFRRTLPIAIVLLALFPFRPNTANATASALPGSSIVNFCHDRDILGNTYTFCALMEFTSDCDGWSVATLDLTNPSPYQFCAPFVVPYVLNGSWIDESQIESYDWNWQYTTALCDSLGNYITMLQYDISYTIMEPDNCPIETARSCLLTPRYYMYTFHDRNQPDTWQDYCYIISNKGYPSVESQARICSVQGFDHVYRATRMVYQGWVSTDCHGATYYGWPNWQSEWYRPGFAR